MCTGRGELLSIREYSIKAAENLLLQASLQVTRVTEESANKSLPRRQAQAQKQAPCVLARLLASPISRKVHWDWEWNLSKEERHIYTLPILRVPEEDKVNYTFTAQRLWQVQLSIGSTVNSLEKSSRLAKMSQYHCPSDTFPLIYSIRNVPSYLMRKGNHMSTAPLWVDVCFRYTHTHTQ